PVGYRIVGNKAELTDFWAVLGNSTLWAEWTHTVLAAFVTGSMFVLGVSAWRLLKGDHVAAFTRAAELSAGLGLLCVVATMVTGDWQARLMDDQQPMKMAAAEAVYRTQYGPSFSLLTIGNLSGQPVFQIRIPHLLSLIATLSWNGKVVGVAQAQQDELLKHGPGSYVPVLWVTYWSFRLMVGLGFLILIISAWALWRARRGGKPLEAGRWTLWVLVACIAAPFAANTFGWLFTEMGRQPWIVYGLMKTGLAGSPSVSATDVAVTLGGFVFLYTALGVTDVILMYIVARRGLGPDEPDQGDQRRSPGGQPEAGELVY
ncbi:MAG TPA: cytochrome ubiquinol oxidase subunit I, partial [Streptosporangiaceae bacterium]